ncbi:MAG: MGMT family protein [Candidatus Kariarchaeaceae archaeon]|jgi:O-6-methylguanine DNA methyltransferase
MKNISYTISTKDDKTVGLIESKTGLVMCTTPFDSKEFVKTRIIEAFQKLGITDITKLQKKHSLYIDAIFSLDNEPLDGWGSSLSIPIDYRLYTQKQKKVAETLREIPPGTVITYGELAEKSGINNGARFVGNCMAGNFLPLIIPCHRVVNSKRELGNYSSGGPERKYDYLQKENALMYIKK